VGKIKGHGRKGTAYLVVAMCLSPERLSCIIVALSFALCSCTLTHPSPTACNLGQRVDECVGTSGNHNAIILSLGARSLITDSFSGEILLTGNPIWNMDTFVPAQSPRLLVREGVVQSAFDRSGRVMSRSDITHDLKISEICRTRECFVLPNRIYFVSEDKTFSNLRKELKSTFTGTIMILDTNVNATVGYGYVVKEGIISASYKFRTVRS